MCRDSLPQHLAQSRESGSLEFWLTSAFTVSSRNFTMGDDNRHEMMESLFGAESGDSDEEPEPKPSDSNNSNSANSGRDDEEGEGEGGGDAEVESDMDGGESERAVSENGREVESEAEREVSDREVASDRELEEPEDARSPSISGSETSHHRRGPVEYDENDVEEVRDASEHGDDEQGENEQVEDEAVDEEQVEDEAVDEEQVEEEPVDEDQVDDEQQASAGVAEARDVFGDSDEDDQEVERRRSMSRERSRSPAASAEKGVHSEDDRSDHDVGRDVDDGYESEEGRYAEKKREKPVGPPLHLEVPLRPPPGRSEQLNLVRVSNIMGIESKPFDPKTYEEDQTFVTDAEGQKQRLRLEENIARWRIIRNRDGSESIESNARFVKWSDGSMQLLLGSEVLDLSVQDSRHDQSHLFLRHPKSLLQSQGRLLRKMKFMPSSLSSKSHKLLTALVDSRHKKVLKVRSIITNIDPDKEKEVQEKAVEQRIRSKSDLQRKQDKMVRKYSHMPSRERDAQLSPGYLDGALDEEEEADDYDRHGRRGDSRRFQQQLDDETRAERRILSAKRHAQPSRRPSVKDRRPPLSRKEMLEDSSEEEREESAYETEPEDEDELPLEDEEREYNDEDEEEEEDNRKWSDKGKSIDREDRRRYDRDDDRKRRRDRSEERDASPPRKSVQRRRVVVSDDED
ncbi:hypothetical protein R1flu_021254 [Riccia fluitans]|uniref:Leo1-like protein n=1 Tax=Riccia fluitans TaxID=41844 RepID=A0ABD1ZQH9_9MARC